MDEVDPKTGRDDGAIAVGITPERSGRSENSVIEALPEAAKTERIASMRRELADLHRHLIDAQQRVATELQGRAEDAERLEALEALVQERELASMKDATRTGALESEIATLRGQLATAAAATEDLRRELAAREATIADTAKQREELEARTAALNEVKTQLEARDAELTKRSTEHETERETRLQAERQLEDHRRQQRELSEQLEVQLGAVRDAKALITTLHTELAAATKERDELKAELEPARSELETARTKLRDAANHLVRIGQELGDGGVITPTEPKPRRTPPPMPAATPPPIPHTPTPRTAAPTAPVVETIVMTEEAKPRSRVGAVLFAAGGVMLGCIVTFALMNGRTTRAAADDQPAAPPGPVAKASPPIEEHQAPVAIQSPVEPIAAPAPIDAPRAEPPPPANPPPTTGVLVLPASASGHRIYVDGKVVEVKGSRASVACGSHEVRIGSSGTPRKLDIPCGGETALPDDRETP